MSKIRYSEMFYSIQGEGKYVGVPSVFLRLFGCNFECAGFGQKRNQPLLSRDKMPWKQLDVSKYKSIQELPIMPIGCDSSASWAKEYMRLSTFEDSSVIAKKLVNLCPDNSLIPSTKQDVHLILTGGEPLMWQKQIPDLLDDEELIEDLKNITFETNSTFALNDSFVDYLESLSTYVTITWACSPKLSLSGEVRDKAIRPENWLQYSEISNSNLYLKFVVEDKIDVEEVKLITRNLPKQYDIYLMSVGGTLEQLQQNEKRVCDLAMENGYKFSPRLHVQLFGNKWGT